MKKIIATSENYNSLQILKSVTYHYEDGTSKTYQIISNSTNEEKFDEIKSIATLLNQSLDDE